MNSSFLSLIHSSTQTTLKQTLTALNTQTQTFGLSLSEEQINYLLERRSVALENTGRIEFGESVLIKIIQTFSNSAHLSSDNYEETLAELQDLFFFIKNESNDCLSDDEILSVMKHTFETKAQGCVDYLSDILEEMLYNKTFSVEGENL